MRVRNAKKTFALLLTMLVCSGLFYACNGGSSGSDPRGTLLDAAPADGDQVAIWLEGEQSIVGTDKNLDKRTVGIDSSIDDDGLPVYEGSAAFDVHYDSANDVYTFTCDGKYLTSTGTNDLALTDTADANGCSNWKLENTDNGWLVVNAVPTEDGDGVYLEYYKTGFTTYTYSGSNTEAYAFNFYAFNGYAADPKLSWKNQKAPTGLSATAPVDASNNSGTISGTTAQMEYKLTSDPEYITCTEPRLENLLPGNYIVRYTEKDGYNASSDTTVTVPFFESSDYVVNDLVMQPGADESQMNFCWYSNSAETPVVQVSLASAMDGSIFPDSSAQTFSGTAAASGNYTSNEVAINGLAENTPYVYRVGNGTSFGAVYEFQTHGGNSYEAILVGDPQIGCSGNVDSDMTGWKGTVSQSLTTFPDCSFILSAGDQVETGMSETQYDGFLNAPELVSTPLVPTIGNHDNASSLYKYHYYSPNESADYGITDAGGDYYFTYGNTLFMVLNSNNKSALSHETFMGEAIAAAGNNFAWKIVMFHHSIYSSATHSADSDILNRRNELYPIFDELGIDVVVMGHDHVYSRSYQMLGGVAQKDQITNTEGKVVDPTGTLYVTANSSSGSKYYDLIDQDTDYRAYRWQEYAPSYSHITVTDNTFSITTLTSADNTVIDSYSIYKSNN